MEEILNFFTLTPWGRVKHKCISKLSLAQLMACPLSGAKPSSEPMWNIVNWTLENKLQLNLYIFINENAFENIVRKIVAILLE